jgi:23S rRNA pseudouridine1911/1915/1917 synthase
VHPRQSSPLPEADQTTRLDVGPDDAGKRLDAFLAERLPDLSRARLQALIRDGRVGSTGGLLAEPSRRVKEGERITLAVPPPVAAAPRPEAMPLEVLFEDDHLIVLVKPSGMVVHPAPGHAAGTLVNALLAHCGASLSGIGGVRRPGIVHRLDKEVSGVLVVAKHDRAHLGLAGQFTVHSVHRVYEAVVWGVPSPAEGRIDRPIGRHARDRVRMAVVAGGKRAVTDYRLIGAAGLVAARLEVALQTGRTHQIRVHLSSLGHPIVGDRLYADRRTRAAPAPARDAVQGLGRPLLHARELGFVHPVTKAELSFASPPPPLFDELLALLGS